MRNVSRVFVPCSEDRLLRTVAELHCTVSAPSQAATLQGNAPLLNTKHSRDSSTRIQLKNTVRPGFAQH